MMLNWAFNSCFCFLLSLFRRWIFCIFKLIIIIIIIRLFCSLGCTAEAHVPVSWCCAKCWWEGYCKETNPVFGSWFWHYIFSVKGALIYCLVPFTFYVYIYLHLIHDLKMASVGLEVCGRQKTKSCIQIMLIRLERDSAHEGNWSIALPNKRIGDLYWIE